VKNFQGRVAVITGAGSGFGREFAREGASLGMKLVLADIQDAPLQETVTMLRAEFADVKVVSAPCDVSRASDMDALAKLAMDSFGVVNLVFNNAGVGSGGLIWENTVKDWEWVLGVNVWGVIHGVRAFVPLMLETAKRDADFEGYIVNTASMAGLLSPPLMGAYNVSKHAVVALSETLFQDLIVAQKNDADPAHAQKINCSVLCPAFVPTGISKSHRARPDALQNSEAPTESMMLAQSLTHKAVSSGKLSAADVSNITFNAIRENRFYIITHPKIMATVQMRLDDIANLTNPRDPFALKADARPQLAQNQ
jgi:NAD(P)-dependent dehydrogenase (short-subunit alcohol dehydrogenase family)